MGCTYKYASYICRNSMRMTRAAFVNLFYFVAAMFWSQYIIRTNVQRCTISAYWQLKGAFPDSDSYTNIIVSHSTSICCCTGICLDLLELFLYVWSSTYSIFYGSNWKHFNMSTGTYIFSFGSIFVQSCPKV